MLVISHPRTRAYNTLICTHTLTLTLTHPHIYTSLPAYTCAHPDGGLTGRGPRRGVLYRCAHALWLLDILLWVLAIKASAVLAIKASAVLAIKASVVLAIKASAVLAIGASAVLAI